MDQIHVVVQIVHHESNLYNVQLIMIISIINNNFIMSLSHVVICNSCVAALHVINNQKSSYHHVQYMMIMSELRESLSVFISHFVTN